VTRYAGPNLMMRALRAGTFDLVFCNQQLTTPEDDFIRVKVFEDSYIVAARRGSSGAEGGSAVTAGVHAPAAGERRLDAGFQVLARRHQRPAET
jgi:DNA-binding transcriptional LysR family regulator